MAAPAPTSPATETPSTPAAGGEGADTSGAQDLILKILGTVGAGIGILGFVTFFGGAILWIRAREANLPANDAVSVVPNSVLVTTGASLLAPAVLLASLAVACIFSVHLGFNLWRKTRKDNKFAQARELRFEADALGRDAEAQVQLAQAARSLATSIAASAEQAEENPTASAELKSRLKKEADKQRQEAERREAAALATTAAAAEKKALAENLQATSEIAGSQEQFRAELFTGGLILLLLPPLLNGAITHVGKGQALALILVALGVVAVSLAVYAATERFIWFGVVAFVTVGIYIGFATYFSTTDNAKVEPAAALRSGHPPVIGIYIADTASNLYLGSFPEPGKPSRLLVLPRAQITDLSVGPLLDRQVARKRAAEIAREECEQVITKPAPEPEPSSGSGPASESSTTAPGTAKPAPPPVEEPACTKTQRSTLDPYLE
jgi:flagellar biosynthesis GTPase FlhF